MVESEKIYDVVIIGGGPAGISCALECHENALDVVVLERCERVGGQLPLIPGPIWNYAAGHFETGENARANLENVSQLFLSERVKTKCNVTSVSLADKVVSTNLGQFKGKAIFLATGYRTREWDVNVPSAMVEDVLYRSGIYKDQLRGKHVAVIGGGDSAVFTAIDLADSGIKVTVLAKGKHLRARPDLVTRMKAHKNIDVHTNAVVKQLVGEDRLEGLRVQNSQSTFDVKCEKVVAKLGYVPNTELFCEQLKNKNGHLEVGQDYATSLNGIFAGGDIVTPGYDRIAFALGSGMMAARSIRCFLGQIS